jgi:hypothetical protein
MKEELEELLRDRFAQLSNGFISLSIILSFLVNIRENGNLFKLSLYIFVVVLIILNSTYILIAQKSIEGVIRPDKQISMIQTRKFPMLRGLAKGGLLLSFIMVVSAFFIPDFQTTFVPVSTATITPSATRTAIPIPTSTFTPSITLTTIATIAPSPTFTTTSIPTSTEVPSATPEPQIFRGLDKNCIDQKYWTVSNEPMPTYKQNAKICYDLSTKSIIAQDEGLRINGSPLDDPTFGMYTKLPPRTDVDIYFKLRIDSFTTNTSSIDSVFLIGISDPDDWFFRHGEYLLHGIRSTYRTANIIREVGESITQASFRWTPDANPNNTYEILFSIRGIDLIIYIDGKTLNYYPRSLSRFQDGMVFWIGYQLPISKSNLQASITDFSIIEK